MTGGPITAMIMHPVVKEELLAEPHLQRLGRSCRLVDPTPFRTFDGLGEESGRVQVLITSWGCPRIDRKVVAAMPGRISRSGTAIVRPAFAHAATSSLMFETEIVQ